MFFCPIASSDKDSGHAKVFSCLRVDALVPDHIGMHLINALRQIALCHLKHSRLRLAAMAFFLIKSNPMLRVVRAIVERIYVCSVTLQHLIHIIMKDFYIRLGIVTSRHTRLVGNDDHLISGLVQETDCLCGTVNQLQIFFSVKIIDLHVHRAITVEEYYFTAIFTHGMYTPYPASAPEYRGSPSGPHRRSSSERRAVRNSNPSAVRLPLPDGAPPDV